MRFATTIFASLVPIILTGCSHMNSHFDCSLQKGATCKSLSEINHMIDTGHVGGGKIKKSKAIKKRKISSSNTPKPVRLPEEVMRVWVAPHQDAHGHYHGEKYIYAVVKSSEWLGLEQG